MTSFFAICWFDLSPVVPCSVLSTTSLANYDGSVGRKWATAIYFRPDRRVKFLANIPAGTAFDVVGLGDVQGAEVVPLSRSSVSQVVQPAYFQKRDDIDPASRGQIHWKEFTGAPNYLQPFTRLSGPFR